MGARGEERGARLMICHVLACCTMLCRVGMCIEGSAYLLVAVVANGLSVRRQRGGAGEEEVEEGWSVTRLLFG
jgi:hypothetical protein